MESFSIFPFVCLWFSETFLNFIVSVGSLCGTVLYGCTAVGLPFLLKMNVCFVSVRALWRLLLWPFL